MTGCDVLSNSYHSTSIMTDTNNNGGGANGGLNSGAGVKDGTAAVIENVSNISDKDKYSLRPRSMRRKAQQVKNVVATIKPNKSAKPKEKPPPLSKYRRKTANARERSRMREINTAFETLRKAVPHVAPSCSSSQPASANEKLTKITTLRLAMKYISTLSAALSSGESECSSVSAVDLLSDCSDLDCLLSDGESLQFSEHSLLTSPDFPDSSLSPVDFGDPSLPSLMHTDFADDVLESPFSDYFLT